MQREEKHYLVQAQGSAFISRRVNQSVYSVDRKGRLTRNSDFKLSGIPVVSKLARPRLVVVRTL